MKTKLTPGILALAATLLSTLFHQPSTSFAQGTAFTYQGRLNDGANPASGTYDLRFKIYDAASNGATQGVPLTNSPTAVSNGLFTVSLDFGNQFPGADRWLEIGVRTNGGGTFTTLSPRQPMTTTPYAITAGNLSGALPSASLSGTYANAVTLNNGANSFTGSGAGLTALDANQLTSGTVSSAALGNAWKTTGNSGTTPGPQFVGTTDNQALELKVNNQRGLRLEPTASTDTVNVIGGSARNFVGAGVVGATIGGGGSGNYLGGAFTNRVEADFGTVSGGLRNTIHINGLYSTIGGGVENTIQLNSTYATIGGGSLNLIQDSSFSANIGGGYGNTIQVNTYSATIGGGELNRVESLNHSATIGGGYGNVIQPFAYYATIGGGHGNTTQPSADYATIPGGRENSAASYGFAAGRRAKANHTGAFVWADAADADFASTVANQFAIRASGGVRLSDSTPNLSFGNTTRQMLNLFEAPDPFNSSYGIGVQADTLYFRCSASPGVPLAGFRWYQVGIHHDGNGNACGGTELMSLGSGYLYVNGTLVSSSDRNVKQDFAAVNSRAVLEKVAQLPIQTWAYKSDPHTKHLGPVAQDFYAAFNVGPDDKHITTVDESGVALAAIQGLNQKVDSENATLRTENAELKQRLEKLERLINHQNGGAK